MDEIQVKVKLWIDAITKEKMDGVAYELEEILGGQATEKKNKIIFKLLLHLSHTANKYDKSKSEIGLEIWRIGCWICSNMTDIPDAKKFFSSVYHVTSGLLDTSLYREALEICDYILPGKLWKNELTDYKDIYSKVSQLVHNAALILLKRSKLASRKHYEILLMLIKYELDITKLAHRSYWRYVLSKILLYCEKVGAITDISTESLKEEFKSAMLTYIGQEEISLDNDNREHTYRLIFLLITELIVRDINKTKIGSIEHTLIRYFDVFRSCLQNYQSYLRCFNLYERLLTALVRPVKNISSHVIQEIAACSTELRKIVISYGYGDAIKWYSYSAVLLLSELMSYWEEIAKGEMVRYLTNALIVSTLNFLEEQSNIFNCYEITACRCSEPKKCNITYDLYNSVALRLKALSVVSRLLSNTSSKDIITEKIYNIAVALSEESAAGIAAIKEGRCKQWSLLWPVCGAHIYNISISCESKYYEKSIQLYSLLCMSFVKLEGAGIGGNAPSLFNLSDPLPTLLHRLTSVHLNNGKYEEAMIVCSLNGLLSSKIINKTNKTSVCKAYYSWANIKHKHPPSHGVTMLECLRLNKQEIRKIIEIRLKDYDLIKVCLREIKGLADARLNLSSSIIMVLDEMERLEAPPTSYAQGVQLLGYHLLNFQCQLSITKYLEKATIKYERASLPSISCQWWYGHIKFYEFIERLHEIGKKTESEMKSAIFALSSSKNTSHGESTSSMSDPENIVPSYSTINITVTKEIESCLEQALRTWKEASVNANNYKDELEDWEISQNLEVITIAGDYARLYHLESLEIETWKLAYNLARDLEDHRAIIYITTRSLTSQRIDRKWIEEADKSVKIIENTNDSTELREIIRRYRLCLADLYYQNEDPKSARKLFDLATAKMDENFMSDIANYLLSVHLRMQQYSIENEKQDELEYSRIIVQSLYAMLAMDDAFEMPISSYKRKQLYNYDLLFEFTNNLALRMNSLLSFREISAHLMRRLSTAQKLGAALRVAECLKSLCYIDLSRAKLDDCEVKLQGLEHILEIEGFDLTMKSQLLDSTQMDRLFLPTSSTSHHVEAVRDVGQNDTSPILRKKIFASPDFILHGDLCICFKCTNSRYQSLVFASTHLRAQLFSLQRNSVAAFQHFEGALTIKKNILSRVSLTNQINSKSNNDLATLRSHRYLDVVEYVAFHLDYCRFLKWCMPERINEGIEIAFYALELCKKYNLKSHPIYVSTNNLIFEYRFESTFSDNHFSKFTVPAVDEMDIGRYIHESTEDRIVCVTPARENVAQKAISVRRRKTPPFLKLEKVPIDLTEEEPAIYTSPPARTRRLRRCNINDTEENFTNREVASERKKCIVSRINFIIPSDDDRDESIVIPNKSNSIGQKPENIDEIESELTVMNCQMENSTKTSRKIRKISQRVSASSQSSNSSNSSRSSNSNSSNIKTTTTAETSVVSAIKIDEVTDLLDELTVTAKASSSLSLVTRRSSKNPQNTVNSGKMNEKVITVPSDDASSSGDEITVETKRASSRLRKTSKDVLSTAKRNKFESLSQSASNSEDEVVIIGTRSRRRGASATEQVSTAKESVKSSRSRVLSKRST